MFPLPIKTWLYIGVAILIAGLALAVKVQTSRLDAVKAEYAAFKAQVTALGEAAKIAAKQHELADKQAKEKADADTKKLLADNADLGKRLRNARSNSGFLPKPPASSPSPERVCFDTTQLERALQRLDDGVQSLISEGDAAKLKLSTAEEWANSVGAQ